MFKVGDTFTISTEFVAFLREDDRDFGMFLPLVGEQGTITAVSDDMIGVRWTVYDRSTYGINLDIDDALALLVDTHIAGKELLNIILEYLDLNGVQEQLTQPGYTWLQSGVIEALETLTKTEFNQSLQPALRKLGYGSEYHVRDVAGKRVMLKVWEID